MAVLRWPAKHVTWLASCGCVLLLLDLAFGFHTLWSFVNRKRGLLSTMLQRSFCLQQEVTPVLAHQHLQDDGNSAHQHKTIGFTPMSANWLSSRLLPLALAASVMVGMPSLNLGILSTSSSIAISAEIPAAPEKILSTGDITNFELAFKRYRENDMVRNSGGLLPDVRGEKRGGEELPVVSRHWLAPF
ncbi:unnamed protein product [Heterosigma akashiwo]